jgi:hypothetical protein
MMRGSSTFDALVLSLAVLFLGFALTGLFVPDAVHGEQAVHVPVLTPEFQWFAVQSGATQVPLSCAPVPNTLILSLNGLEQTPVIDYSISGQVITFTALDPLDSPYVDAHYWCMI